MTRDTIVILGIPIDNLTMDKAVRNIMEMTEAYLRDGRSRYVATVNVDFIVNTLNWNFSHIRHPELLNILRLADMVTADGMPMLWTSRLLGYPLSERVTGADLVPRLAEASAGAKKSIYFLGGNDDIGQQAADLLKKKYENLKIAGVSSPYVHIEDTGLATAEQDDSFIVEKINDSKPDILLIAFGNPKQEIWYARNCKRLKVPVSIGVGGTYEFIVGRVKRAPAWMQKTGLEWIYRITQDPGRLWKRYFVGFFKFGLMILPAVVLFNVKKYLQKKRTHRPVFSSYVTSDTSSGLQVLPLPDPLSAEVLAQTRSDIENQASWPGDMILDLSRVNFIDSTGIGLLISLWRQAKRNKQLLVLAGIKPEVHHFLKISRAADLFEEMICPNVAEAIALLQKQGHHPAFYYYQESTDGLVEIKLFGCLDADQVTQTDLLDIISQFEANDCLISLNGLRFLDSSGIMLLLKINRHLAGLGKKCLFYGLHDNVSQVFKLSRLDRLLLVFQDKHAAKRHLSGAK